MDRVCAAILLSLSLSSAAAFEKLAPEYQVSYGDPTSGIKIIEYFSLSCPKCISFFEDEFPYIKDHYVDKGVVFWSFHPDPADILTLQFMVCLQKLPEGKKKVFLETFMKHFKEKKLKHGAIIMQAAMEILGYPVPSLEEMEFLEKTDAFRDAFLFIKQEDAVKAIPAVEINGLLRTEYPSRQFLEKAITALTRRSA